MGLIEKILSAFCGKAAQSGNANTREKLPERCVIEKYLLKSPEKCAYFGVNTVIENAGITWLASYNKIGFLIESRASNAEEFSLGFLEQDDVLDVYFANNSIGKSSRPSVEINTPALQISSRQFRLIDLIKENKKIYAYLSSQRLSGKPLILTFSTEPPVEALYVRGKQTPVNYVK